MIQPYNDTSPMESSATTTAVASGIPTDDPKQNLTQVINSIQKPRHPTSTLPQRFFFLMSPPNSPLLQRMNNLVVSELDNMTRLAKNCNIQMLMDVLNLIDDGKKPDKFTQDMLNGCIAKNQITKGKTYSFKVLRRHLPEELNQTFPNEVESYRETRISSAAATSRYTSIL